MNGIFVLVPIMVLGIAVAGIVSASILKIQRLKLEEARLRAGDPDDMNDLPRCERSPVCLQRPHRSSGSQDWRCASIPVWPCWRS
jgi:hypothetical protein